MSPWVDKTCHLDLRKFGWGMKGRTGEGQGQELHPKGEGGGAGGASWGQEAHGVEKRLGKWAKEADANGGGRMHWQGLDMLCSAR